MAAINVRISNEEYELLKEFRNPGKWGDWRQLNKKCRYVLQRMLVGQPGAHEIVMDMAKEASHNLGHCRWCGHEPVYEIAREIFK